MRDPALSLRPLGDLAQFLHRRRGGLHEIRTPVEQSDVDEPGEGIQTAVPLVRLDGGGWKVFDVGFEAIQGKDPACRCELRRPDDVELQDVRLAGTGVQPLHVQLVPLIRRVRRTSLHDADLRVLGHESVELPSEHLGLGPDGAAGEDDFDGSPVCLRGTGYREQDERAQPQADAETASLPVDSNGELHP